MTTGSMSPNDLSTRHAVPNSDNDPDFIYDQDDEDPDFDPSMPNCDTDNENPIADTHNIEGHHAKYETKCPKALTDQIWSNKLREMSAEELGSPKVKCIADLVVRVQSDYPGEKLITASASVRFLYILGEYLSRLLPALTTVHFDGRTTSVDDRVEIANRFNSEGGGIDLPELP
ncbi:hypothetical protein HYE67_009058 [Fusarium culmorum]|uniref:Uncharacterized protein n=1 Tax=Fusarium culmorum TaxID=5516 RepID=A0A2T4H979_FUSCU|nr:hypothetical protein FCULG_00003769 [Fusarium culmorum]QPC66827.1 hypothetical protein HYE67_009058 [Fusarium culmorum]